MLISHQIPCSYKLYRPVLSVFIKLSLTIKKHNALKRIWSCDVCCMYLLKTPSIFKIIVCVCVCGCGCGCVCRCVCVVSSEASAQQEHEEDSAEENAEGTHGRNHNLCHHPHVAYQGIWNTQQTHPQHTHKSSTPPSAPANWLKHEPLYLNFIMYWPSLWLSCKFLIFLGHSSSWRGKTKRIPVKCWMK